MDIKFYRAELLHQIFGLNLQFPDYLQTSNIQKQMNALKSQVLTSLTKAFLIRLGTLGRRSTTTQRCHSAQTLRGKESREDSGTGNKVSLMSSQCTVTDC